MVFLKRMFGEKFFEKSEVLWESLFLCDRMI